jgi:hypothetical protein
LQAGVQVAPGWHLQLGPHLHAGPQAQDFALVWLAVVTDAGLERLAVVFI